MNAPVSIFLDFNLPNATTWFYFSFLLAMALFFKFNRLFSLRNWDLITLFLLVPGLLLLQSAKHQPAPPQEQVKAEDVAQLVLQGGQQAFAAPAAGAVAAVHLVPPRQLTNHESNSVLWFPYLWLLGGSAYLLLRCLADLALIRRPALAPNLNFAGLAWLAGALFICLAAVAYRPPTPEPGAAPSAPPPAAPVKSPETVGQPTAAVELAQTSLQNSLGPSFWLLRTVAILCHLSVVAGLIVLGARHFQDAAAGMAAATFYLLLPITGYYVHQVHHVWPMALLIWAFVFYRQPTVAGLFFGLAAGTALSPALILPTWISFYWRRGAGRFSVACALSAGLCLALTGYLLSLENSLDSTISRTLASPVWQPWQLIDPTHEGFWRGVHWAYRLPVFIVYLALVIPTAFWPFPKNLAHVIALSALVLIGIQFWYADQGGVYILWYLPLVLLLVFRPNLAGHRPAFLQPETDWVAHLRKRFRGLFSRLLKVPDTLARIR
jgi:hypothetical protein